MKLIIDISKDRYDEIMSMDWKNCRRFFDEEIRAIHDGRVLEQYPCEDAISRQAVLDINERHHGQMPNHVNHEIWKEIKAFPSVTPQQKMGRWIARKDEYGDVCEDVCSCCGKNGNYKWKFCPNCGCKMQEVEND